MCSFAALKGNIMMGKVILLISALGMTACGKGAQISKVRADPATAAPATPAPSPSSSYDASFQSAPAIEASQTAGAVQQIQAAAQAPDAGGSPGGEFVATTGSGNSVAGTASTSAAGTSGGKGVELVMIAGSKAVCPGHTKVDPIV
jgi:hypothetical protein